MTMRAQIRSEPRQADKRRRPRRELRLPVSAAAAASGVVRNLSETGLLLESEAALTVNELVTMVLPVAGDVQARVVWSRAPFYGLEFLRPVSRATVSAALLKSPIDEPAEMPAAIENHHAKPEPADVGFVRRNRGDVLVALATLGLAACLALIALVTARLV